MRACGAPAARSGGCAVAQPHRLFKTGRAAERSAQVANNAGAAGYTILCIFNFCLLIVLGFESDATGAVRVRPEEIPMTGV